MRLRWDTMYPTNRYTARCDSMAEARARNSSPSGRWTITEPAGA